MQMLESAWRDYSNRSTLNTRFSVINKIREQVLRAIDSAGAPSPERNSCAPAGPKVIPTPLQRQRPTMSDSPEYGRGNQFWSRLRKHQVVGGRSRPLRQIRHG